MNAPSPELLISPSSFALNGHPAAWDALAYAVVRANRDRTPARVYLFSYADNPGRILVAVRSSDDDAPDRVAQWCQVEPLPMVSAHGAWAVGVAKEPRP